MDQHAVDQTSPADAADTAMAMLSSPAMDLIFLPPARLGVQSAWYGHVPFAHWLVGAIAPRLVVELGTHNGVSYSAFCEAVAHTRVGARCVAVDTWEGDEHAGFYGDAIYDEFRRFHDPRYGGFSEVARCSFDTARAFVTDGTVDLLHIDGLHTYEAVRHDWENWRSSLSERGIVLFHDINEHQGSFGVWRLWEELRASSPSFTFLHGHGLGVLAPGSVVPEAMRALLETAPASAAASRLRDRFAQLGQRWVSQYEQDSGLDHRRAAEARNAGLRQEVATLGRSLAETSDEVYALRQRALAAETELGRLDQLSDERDGLRTREASLASDLDRSRTELDRNRVDLAFRAAEWERVHQVMAARDADRDALQREHDAVLRSASWRVSARLVRLGRATPGAAQARRAARLARLAVGGGLGRHLQERRRMRAEIERLKSSPLFDVEFYRAATPDLAASGLDAVEHYVTRGARAGARPNAAFDTGWYVARHADLMESGENPLLHWQRLGASSGADPGPLFDTACYVANNPDGSSDPLLHYLQVGAPNDLDPNPMFDAAGYRLTTPKASRSGLGALAHWLRFGVGQGHDPHPLFDSAWYRARHHLPADRDPLAHWMQFGRAGHAPTCALLERTDAPIRPLAFAPEEEPEVSVIVPVWGHYADTVRCLYALMESDASTRFEVLVADDNPDEPTAPLLARRIPGLRTHENPSNLGFLRSCNQAAGRARGRILVFLNNDAQVRPGWLEPLVALFAERPDAGLVGCKLLNPDGTVQEAGGAITSDGWGVPYGSGGDPDDPRYGFVREVDVVVGACLAVRRDAWEAARGFDEDFAPAFYEEFDLAFTLRKLGWRVFYQPESVVDHMGSNSYGAAVRDRQSTRNHARFCRKWAAELRDQPAPGTPELRLRRRPHDSRTVLFIDDRVPEWDRHAGALTVLHYLELWQSMGFGVAFAPAADTRPTPPYTGRLQQKGIEVLHGAGALDRWLAQHGASVDVIWTARPDVTGPMLQRLRERSGAPILYYPHDLHHLRERRRWEIDGDPRALSESERYARLERRVFTGVDRVLAISAKEATIMRALAPSADVRMMPPYLYPPPPPPPDATSFAARDAVLFVGGYAHPPNVDAARFIATEIMPLVWQAEPDVRLILAGASPTAEILNFAGPLVEVPGFLPDLTPLTRRARLSVSPLRYGAGVKGKMVAALWDGLPVVCTPVADEGLDLVDGVEAAIAADARGLADRLVALWRDPDTCAAMAVAGQAVVRRRFTREAAAAAIWSMIAAGRRRETLSSRPL